MGVTLPRPSWRRPTIDRARTYILVHFGRFGRDCSWTTVSRTSSYVSSFTAHVEYWVAVLRSIARHWWCVRKPIKKSSKGYFESVQGRLLIDAFGKDVPQPSSFYTKWVVVSCSHRSLGLVVVGGYFCSNSQPIIIIEHHFDVVWGILIENLPSVDDCIALPPSLKWLDFKLL